MRSKALLWSALLLPLAVVSWYVLAASRTPPPDEDALRRALNVGPNLEIRYRSVDCHEVGFAEFSKGLRTWSSFTSRAFDPAGGSVTLTVARKGARRCPFPYARVTAMPELDATDLGGARVTSADLRGRFTVMTVFFATCPTCRRDVSPLNTLAARHPELNTLAVTYEPPDVARAFVAEQGFQWRVVPAEPAFIRRAGVYVYPTVILFAPDGTLVARLTGGVKGGHDERSLAEGLERWLAESLARG